MGSGIAEVAAKAGFEVVLRSRSDSGGRRDGRGAREVARQAGRQGQARGRPTATPRSAGSAPSPTSPSSPSATSCIESIVEDLAAKKHLFNELDRICARPHDPRDQHVDAPGRRDGDGDRPARPGVRHPLLQPGADDGARRGGARDHDDRRDDRRGAALREACGKNPVQVRDQAGFIVNALLFPYLNNAVKLLDARRRDARRHRRRDEGRLQLPDGPARAARPRRARHEPGDPRGALRRVHDPNYAPAPLLRRMVTAERLGRKTGPASTTTRKYGARGASVPSPAAGRMKSSADRPWVMRTYSGHSSAARRTSSTARTWPRARRACRSPSTCRPRPATTPTTSWPAARSARSACRSPTWARCARSSTGSRIEEMNTSMTINATAMWLLAMYVALGRGAGRRPVTARGHDPERHRQGVPVPRARTSSARSRRADSPSTSCATRCATSRKWNPINVCSYHLQEAGATPVAGDRVRAGHGNRRARRRARRRAGHRRRAVRGGRPDLVLRRTRASASSRRCASMRAFARLWDRITAERYGVTDEKLRRFRYGVQVNSLGLTEAQPENNVQRIVLETLGVTLSKRRSRPVDPAPGLERGARTAAPMGPAMVAADPAGARIRDRSARVRRPVRRIDTWSRRRRMSSRTRRRPSCNGCSTAAAPSR